MLPLTFALFQVDQDRAAAEAAATHDAANGAQLAAAQIEDLLAGARGLGRTLELSPRFWTSDDNEHDIELFALQQSQPDFGTIHYFTADLQEHGASNHQPGQVRPDQSSRKYAVEAVATGQMAFSSEPVVGVTTHLVVLQVAIPLRPADADVPVGYLATGLQVAHLPQLWSDLPLPEASRVLLIDGRNGMVLTASSDPGTYLGSTIGPDELTSVRAESVQWVDTTLPGGGAWLRASNAVDGSPWYVAVDVPRDVLFAPMNAKARERILEALAIFVVTLGALVILWWRLRRRVTALQHAAGEWSTGNWQYRAGLRRSDELGQVGAALDLMAEERLRAESALHESEERLRLLIESASDFAIVMLSPEGNVVTWNAGAERVTGYSADEVLGRPLTEVLTSEAIQQDMSRLLLQEAATNGRATAAGWRVRKDGTLFWADVVVTALRDGSGALRGFANVVRDTTDRKRADEAQRQHADHLAAIITAQTEIASANLDPTLLMDLLAEHVKELTAASGASIELLEHEQLVCAAATGIATRFRGQRLGLHTSLSGECIRTDEVLLAQDTLTDPRVDQMVSQDFAVRSMAVTPLKHDSRTVGVLKIVSPKPHEFGARQVATLRLMAGMLGAALSHAQQFNDRVRAESAARAMADRLSTVLRATTEVAIVGCDLHANITFFNQGAERMTGYAAEEVIGRNVLLIHDRAELEERAKAAGVPIPELFRGPLRVRDAYTTEWTYVRKDGSHLTVEMTLTPMRGASGEHVGFVGVATDITQRKAIDRMKDEFISVVSHELRTPLTAIRASLGMLAGGVLGPLPAKGQRMLEISLSNAERLVRLVNDILDLERMRSGGRTMHPQDSALPELIDQAIEAIRPVAEQAGIRLCVEPLDITLHADPDALAQVLTNLLSNAIKFSEAGTTVTVRACRVADSVRIEVRDQGRGIPADQLERIFERFQQVDASDSRAKGGTGLGLAICRMILDLHGGRIWAESTPGAGSTFVIELPAAAPVAPALS